MPNNNDVDIKDVLEYWFLKKNGKVRESIAKILKNIYLTVFEKVKSKDEGQDIPRRNKAIKAFKELKELVKKQN